MWPDSFARNRARQDGCARRAHPAPSSPDAGRASRSRGRDAACAARRRSRASRCAWPSPIGEETKSARLRRDLPRTQRRAGAGGATKSRSSRLTLTGSRTCGPCPDPSSRTSSPPVSSARAIPRPGPVIASSAPWIDEHRAADAATQVARRVLIEHLPELCRDERLSRRLEPPADAVLDRLRRVRLREHLREEELEEACVVAEPVVAVVLRPALVGVELLVPGIELRDLQPARRTARRER